MDYRSLIERKLEPVGKMNNEVVYRCPNCEGVEGSGHLYVNYQKGYFNCFKCNTGGKRLEGLLKILNIDLGYDYDKLYTEHDKSLDNIINSKKDKKSASKRLVDYSTDLEILTLYYLEHTAPLSERAYNYLLDRGLTPYMIEKLGIQEGVNRYGEHFTIKGKEVDGRDYSGRIMVPSLRKDGLISFYVGRDYIGDKKSKYLNPPKELAAASEDVWNLDMVTSDSVIICEGVFTAIAASPMKLNAVATYGKSIAMNSSSDDTHLRVTSQGEKLLDKKFKNYYVAYDADARTEAINSCRYLYDRGANVYVISIDPKKYGPKADVADIGYAEFVKLMQEAVPYKGDLSII